MLVNKLGIGASKPLRERFNATVDSLFLFMLETKGKPLGKIDTIKNIHGMLYRNFRALKLPTPPFPNVHKFGVVSVDVELPVYAIPELEATEKEFDIPDAKRPVILERCREMLSSETIELIKKIVENQSEKVGKDFSSWVNHLGIGKESVSMGNEQIDKYLLGPAEEPCMWIFNPRLLEHMSTDFNIYSIGGIVRGEKRRQYSPEHGAYLHCKSLLRNLAVTEKKRLVVTNDTWMFRINKLPLSQNVREKSMVLYTGRVIRVDEKHYFVEAFYNASEVNRIEIDYFEGIETDWVYAMVGQLVEKDFVIPYGLLKLNRIIN